LVGVALPESGLLGPAYPSIESPQGFEIILHGLSQLAHERAFEDLHQVLDLSNHPARLWRIWKHPPASDAVKPKSDQCLALCMVTANGAPGL